MLIIDQFILDFYRFDGYIVSQISWEAGFYPILSFVLKFKEERNVKMLERNNGPNTSSLCSHVLYQVRKTEFKFTLIGQIIAFCALVGRIGQPLTARNDA